MANLTDLALQQRRIEADQALQRARQQAEMEAMQKAHDLQEQAKADERNRLKEALYQREYSTPLLSELAPGDEAAQRAAIDQAAKDKYNEILTSVPLSQASGATNEYIANRAAQSGMGDVGFNRSRSERDRSLASSADSNLTTARRRGALPYATKTGIAQEQSLANVAELNARTAASQLPSVADEAVARQQQANAEAAKAAHDIKMWSTANGEMSGVTRNFQQKALGEQARTVDIGEQALQKDMLGGDTTAYKNQYHTTGPAAVIEQLQRLQRGPGSISPSNPVPSSATSGPLPVGQVYRLGR